MARTRISREDVARVAALAHLELTDEQVSRAQQDLDAVLTYVDKLQELDVEDIAPTTHAIPLAAPTREDVIIKTLTRDEVLANAPEAQDGSFAAPRIVGGGN